MSKVSDESFRKPLASGPVCTVWAHVRWNGRCPAWEYLVKLSEINQARFAAEFAYHANSGELRGSERFRKIRSVRDVYELKIWAHRLGAFKDGRDWVITHGWPKKQKRQTDREAETVKSRRDEYVAAKRG